MNIRNVIREKPTEWKATASMRLGFACASLVLVAVLLGFVLSPYGMSPEEMLEDLGNMRKWGLACLLAGCVCGYFSYVIGREAMSEIGGE